MTQTQTVKPAGKSAVKIGAFPDPARKLLHMGRGDVLTVKGIAGPVSLLRKSGDALSVIPYVGPLGTRTDDECAAEGVVTVALSDVAAIWQKSAPVAPADSAVPAPVA